MKKKKVLIVIIIILIIAVCILLTPLGIKFFKISSILEKMNNNNQISNIMYTSENGDMIVYHYKKDGKILTTSGDDCWYTGLETNYFVSLENKTYVENIDDMEFNLFSFSEEIDTSFSNKLNLALNLKIKNEDYEGINCYFVEFDDGTQYWIEKETGYILKIVEDELNTIYIKDIEIDTVTDEMIELPDLSEYTKLDSNEYNSYTYIEYDITTSDVDDTEFVHLIFTFDKNDKCVDSRFTYIFSTEEAATEQYNGWLETGLINLSMDSTKVSFNTDQYLGKTKDEIKEISFGDEENIEIFEY